MDPDLIGEVSHLAKAGEDQTGKVQRIIKTRSMKPTNNNDDQIINISIRLFILCNDTREMAHLGGLSLALQEGGRYKNCISSNLDY